jgi:hypothetical protein
MISGSGLLVNPLVNASLQTAPDLFLADPLLVDAVVVDYTVFTVDNVA